MPLNDIVNVQITRQTRSVSEAGFGIPNILGTFKNFNERIRFYSSMQEVSADFQPEQDVYQAAQAVFSQPITPDQIGISRRQADDATVDVITALSGKTYTAKINGVDYTITATNTNQESTVTFDADFVASNAIVITLNGATLATHTVGMAETQLQAMTALAALITGQTANIESVEILPDGVNPNRVLKVHSKPNKPGVVNSVGITGGISQPGDVIVNTAQAVTIEYVASALTNEINGTATDVTAVDNLDGTFTISPVVSATPFTLSVSVGFSNGNTGLLSVLDASPNTLYEVIVNGVTLQYTSPNSVTSNEQIAAALTLLINAAEPQTGVNCGDNLDGTISLASVDSTKTMTIQVTPFIMQYVTGMIVEPLTPSESVTDSLNAIQAVDDTWYALACTDRTSATVQSIAAWIEPQVKIFGTASSDPNIINQSVSVDTTSIAAILKNAGYVRSFVIYHQDADSEFVECAWFGNCLPLVPGSETWAFKTLAGVAYSTLSTTQENNAFAKNCNTYEYVGGFGITQKGTVAVGEYIDIVRGVDWLTSTIQNYVYSVLVNNPKVPYTDSGITSIEAQVLRALSQGISNNFIANDPAPVVTVPKAANVSSADKAARILRNVTFTATLAGAIQAVRITGTVSV